MEDKRRMDALIYQRELNCVRNISILAEHDSIEETKKRDPLWRRKTTFSNPIPQPLSSNNYRINKPQPSLASLSTNQQASLKLREQNECCCSCADVKERLRLYENENEKLEDELFRVRDVSSKEVEQLRKRAQTLRQELDDCIKEREKLSKEVKSKNEEVRQLTIELNIANERNFPIKACIEQQQQQAKEAQIKNDNGSPAAPMESNLEMEIILPANHAVAATDQTTLALVSESQCNFLKLRRLLEEAHEELKKANAQIEAQRKTIEAQRKTLTNIYQQRRKITTTTILMHTTTVHVAVQTEPIEDEKKKEKEEEASKMKAVVPSFPSLEHIRRVLALIAKLRSINDRMMDGLMKTEAEANFWRSEKEKMEAEVVQLYNDLDTASVHRNQLLHYLGQQEERLANLLQGRSNEYTHNDDETDDGNSVEQFFEEQQREWLLQSSQKTRRRKSSYPLFEPSKSQQQRQQQQNLYYETIIASGAPMLPPHQPGRDDNNIYSTPAAAPMIISSSTLPLGRIFSASNPHQSNQVSHRIQPKRGMSSSSHRVPPPYPAPRQNRMKECEKQRNKANKYRLRHAMLYEDQRRRQMREDAKKYEEQEAEEKRTHERYTPYIPPWPPQQSGLFKKKQQKTTLVATAAKGILHKSRESREDEDYHHYDDGDDDDEMRENDEDDELIASGSHDFEAVNGLLEEIKRWKGIVIAERADKSRLQNVIESRDVLIESKNMLIKELQNKLAAHQLETGPNQVLLLSADQPQPKQEAEMQLLRNDVVGTASSESEPIWPQQLIDYLDQKYGKIVNQQKDEIMELKEQLNENEQLIDRMDEDLFSVILSNQPALGYELDILHDRMLKTAELIGRMKHCIDFLQHQLRHADTETKFWKTECIKTEGELREHLKRCVGDGNGVVGDGKDNIFVEPHRSHREEERDFAVNTSSNRTGKVAIVNVGTPCSTKSSRRGAGKAEVIVGIGTPCSSKCSGGGGGKAAVIGSITSSTGNSPGEKAVVGLSPCTSKIMLLPSSHETTIDEFDVSFKQDGGDDDAESAEGTIEFTPSGQLVSDMAMEKQHNWEIGTPRFTSTPATNIGGAHIATSTKHRTTAKQEGRPISPILSPKSKEKRNKGRKAVMSTNRRKTESAASRRKAVELKRLFDAVKAAPVRLPSIKPPCFWTFGD